MIPGIPGGRMNPRQMKAAMKRMGIETENLEGVEEVVIRTATKEYVFKSAEVSAMTVQGQRTWQIVGEPIVMNRKTEGAPAEKATISDGNRTYGLGGGRGASEGGASSSPSFLLRYHRPQARRRAEEERALPYVDIPRMIAMRMSPPVQRDRHRSQENSAGRRESGPGGVVEERKKFTANRMTRAPRISGAYTPRNVRSRPEIIGTSTG